MISDILSEAVEGIREYSKGEQGMYDARDVDIVVTVMDALRTLLEVPPIDSRSPQPIAAAFRDLRAAYDALDPQVHDLQDKIAILIAAIQNARQW